MIGLGSDKNDSIYFQVLRSGPCKENIKSAHLALRKNYKKNRSKKFMLFASVIQILSSSRSVSSVNCLQTVYSATLTPTLMVILR